MASNKENKENVCDKNLEFDKLTVVQLKNYLRSRGEYVSGNKEELLKRAKGAQLLNKKPLREIQLADQICDEQRRVERFVTPLGEKLPDPKTLKTGWTSDLKVIPNFQYSELYNYMVLSKKRCIDNESNQANRQTVKSKVFQNDRHLYDVYVNPLSDDTSHCFVRAKCIKSLPGDKIPDYIVWVCLSKITGRVHSAGCDCDAGEGEDCNHVSALLHTLVDISKEKEDGLHSSTSKQCKWNMPRKRKLSPKKLDDIEFVKFKRVGEDIVKGERRPSVSKQTTGLNIKPVDENSFAEKLKKCAPRAAWLFTRDDATKSEPSVSIPKLHNVDRNYRDSEDIASEEYSDKFKSYFESLSVTEDECADIEKNTRGQAKNKLWKRARHGRLTSSNFGLVCKRKKDSYDGALKTVMDYSHFENEYVKWGRSHEPAARRKYTLQTKQTVSTCGLYVNKDYPHLAASPDGIVHSSSGKGLLEIKCPYKWRDCTPEEAAKDSQFCCKIVNGNLKLKENHSYFYQIQGQLAISQFEWCDFFIWTLKGTHVERIQFNPKFWQDALLNLNQFYVKAVIPELFTTRVKRGKSLY